MLCNQGIKILTRRSAREIIHKACLFTNIKSPDRVKEFFTTPQASILTHPSHCNSQDVTYKSDKVMGIMEGINNWTTGNTASDIQRTLDTICSSVTQNPQQITKSIADTLPNSEAPINPKICVVHHEKRHLRAVTLGDAGFIVVRDNNTIFQSPRRSFLFNEVPLLKEIHDVAAHAYQTELALQPGDIVIIGSDGLFDNLFLEDIERIVSRSSKEELANNLAGSAMAAGCSTKKTTPFSERVNEETDQLWVGGKPDDVAVVVSSCT